MNAFGGRKHTHTPTARYGLELCEVVYYSFLVRHPRITFDWLWISGGKPCC